MRPALLLALVLGVACGRSAGPPTISDVPPPGSGDPKPVDLIHLGDVELVLRDSVAAKDLLGKRDDFIAALSPFDRQARMGSIEPVGEAAFLSHVRAQTANWSHEESEAVRAAANELAALLERQGITLPITGAIDCVRTSGSEEIPGAPYTRGRTLVFPSGVAPSAGLLAHELFHIMTRDSPPLRDRLYAAVGFHPGPRVQLGGDLGDLRITNPDAPRIEHVIEVTVEGTRRKAAPVTYAARAYSGGTVLEYLQARLVLVDDAGALTSPVELHDFGAVSGFFEQVGDNTSYIIHPEELLAENFRLLATGATNVDSPEILQAVHTALKAE